MNNRSLIPLSRRSRCRRLLLAGLAVSQPLLAQLASAAPAQPELAPPVATCSQPVSLLLDQWQRAQQLPAKQQQLSYWLASAPELELRGYQSQGNQFATQEREVALSVLLHNPWNQGALAEGAVQRQTQMVARSQLLRWQSAGMLLQMQQQLDWLTAQQRALAPQVAALATLEQQLVIALGQQEAVRLDVLQVQQQLSKLQLQQQQQQLAMHSIRQQLAMLSGQDAKAQTRLQGYCFTAPPASAITEQRLAEHPLWRLALLDADYSAWQLAQAGDWQAQPWQVSMQLRQQQAGPMLPVDQQVGISLRIPLGGSQHSAQYAESQRQAHQTNAALVAVQQSMQQQWQSAALQWQQAQQALAAAPLQQQRARQTLDILSAAFKAHELSLSDYLRLQQQAFIELASAEQAPLQLQHAQARLAHAGGFSW